MFDTRKSMPRRAQALIEIPRPRCSAQMARSEAPVALSNWIEDLIHPHKRRYAERYAAYRMGRCDRPSPPETAWASKVEEKIDRLLVMDGLPRTVVSAQDRRVLTIGRVVDTVERPARKLPPTKKDLAGNRDDTIHVPAALQSLLLIEALSSNRVVFALAQVGLRTLGDLAHLSWAEVGEIHGVGPNGLKQLKTSLGKLPESDEDETASRIDAVPPATPQDPITDEADTELHDLAWGRASGVLRTLLTAAAEFTSVQSVWDAIGTGLQSVAASFGLQDQLKEILIYDLQARSGFAEDALRDADALVAELTDRDQHILHKRILADDPVTLVEIASGFGVTRERIRQLQQRIEKSLTERLVPRIRPIAGILGCKLGPIVDGEVLDQLIFTVFQGDDRPGLDLARGMLQTELGYSIAMGVGMTPEANQAAEDLRKSAGALADTDGVVGSHELRATLGDEWLIHWSELLGRANLHRLSGSIALRDTARAKVKAAVLQAGRPVTPDEIADVAGIAAKTVRAHFSRQDDYTRADKYRWGLREWIEDEYEGIPTEIVQRIHEDGGSTFLARLLSELPERFGVSESSVRTFVSTPQFVVKEGRVSLADLSRFRYRDLEDVIDGRTEAGEPYWVFSVKPQYLDGHSLLGFPPELARALGCEPNGRAEAPVRYPVGCSNLSVHWRASTPSGPSLGYLAKPIGKLGIEVGGEVSLICHSDGSVDLCAHHGIKRGSEHEPVVDDAMQRQVASSQSGQVLLEQLKRRRRVFHSAEG